MLSDPAVLLLMYFVLPLWLAAGFADWLCHRATHIETTTGAKESILHILMFTEAGIPLLAAMFLEINALIILIMIAALFLHAATAVWDVRYATTARTVTPNEKHALASNAFDNFEASSYCSPAAAAEDAGEPEIAKTCEGIMQQELAMADWVWQQIPPMTDKYLSKAETGDQAKR